MNFLETDFKALKPNGIFAKNSSRATLRYFRFFFPMILAMILKKTIFEL